MDKRKILTPIILLSLFTGIILVFQKQGAAAHARRTSLTGQVSAELEGRRAARTVGLPSPLDDAETMRLGTLCADAIAMLERENRDTIFTWSFTDITSEAFMAIQMASYSNVPMSAWDTHAGEEAVLASQLGAMKTSARSGRLRAEFVVHELRNGWTGQTPWLTRYACSIGPGEQPGISEIGRVSLQ